MRKKEKCGNIKDIWGVNMRKEKINEIDKYIEYFKTIEKSEPFESEGFITVKNYEIKLNNGKTIHREQIYKSEREGNSVTVLPVTKDNHVILVIEPRVFTKRTVGVEAPAGYVEDGEKASEAAERELLEETGFKAKELIQLSDYFMCLRYILGVVDNNLNNAINQQIGFAILSDLSLMKNKYVGRIYNYLNKLKKVQ